MSVMTFDVRHFANIAAAHVLMTDRLYRSLEVDTRMLNQAATALADVSAANQECFAYRYPMEAAFEDADIAMEIYEEARKILKRTGPLQEKQVILQAMSDVTMLPYNCMEDVDFLAQKPAAMRWLIDFSNAVMRREINHQRALGVAA